MGEEGGKRFNGEAFEIGYVIYDNKLLVMIVK